MKEFDVAIVGAGPAGLFAALSLAKVDGKVRIALIDEGLMPSQRKCPLREAGMCASCKPCHLLQGIGGAGALSSGIINLRPDIGGDLGAIMKSWSEAQKVIDLIDETFVYFGAPKERLFEPDPEKASELVRMALRAGAKFIPARQRHVGTENTIKVIEKMAGYLEASGVNLLTLTKVERVERKGGFFVLHTPRGEVESRVLLLAPGRSGSSWLAREAKRLGIEAEYGPIDVGVRVEVPYAVMEPLTKVVWDPKLMFYTKTFDDRVRTFCTNPRGFVVEEFYDDGSVGVNGETYATKESLNTNFAFLVTIRLTNPMEDSLAYGKSIAKMATKLGGGKPLIQRLGDLLSGRRSTWERIERSVVEPTLKGATSGDIGMALPHRVFVDVLEGLEKLDDLAPGVWGKHTLLYAPEVKYYSLKVRFNWKDLETSVPGIFVAGDGAGLSRGINVAAATGYLAAKGIGERLGVEARLPVENSY
ncbi:MAG: NAD(P)/FAD-dependent oxidoreductase [Caldisphaeraceae archaeon]|nr:NAD(P)/FAD-dependent oxidoreductase [Caldisphaeraceae archaeon]